MDQKYLISSTRFKPWYETLKNKELEDFPKTQKIEVELIPDYIVWILVYVILMSMNKVVLKVTIVGFSEQFWAFFSTFLCFTFLLCSLMGQTSEFSWYERRGLSIGILCWMGRTLQRYSRRNGRYYVILYQKTNEI